MKQPDVLFRTPVALPQPRRLMCVQDRSVFLGSCFAQYIGARLDVRQLSSVCNPLGVLYNPRSIAAQVHQSLSGKEEELPVFRAEREWRCWLTGTLMGGSTEQECRAVVQGGFQLLGTALRSAQWLFVTLGTNVCYCLRSDGQVVTNCHKAPQALFDEVRLSVDECEAALGRMLSEVWQENPGLQVVFTVSPYRYSKYGYHGSQLSKATLLLAVESVCRQYPDHTLYFPAYEILLDELRDYRFYAEDMLHPSDAAVNYIWQCMQESLMDERMRRYIQEYEPIRLALQHRPSEAGSSAYRKFMLETQAKQQALLRKYQIER